ncbi:MAG: hypothetical protein IJJ84_05845, partial [Kiritimatiellae bacterium]|nr:hypothetical protein [Kiritimatiellia bacterium]
GFKGRYRLTWRRADGTTETRELNLERGKTALAFGPCLCYNCVNPQSQKGSLPWHGRLNCSSA